MVTAGAPVTSGLSHGYSTNRRTFIRIRVVARTGCLWLVVFDKLILPDPRAVIG